MNQTPIWDQISTFVGKVGFPIAVASVLLWMFYAFMEKIVVNQTRMLELLQRMVDLHK